MLHEKIVEAEQRYVFVENKHKVAVGDRLKKYNLLTTLVWDYMEQSDYSYHGVIRSWSELRDSSTTGIICYDEGTIQ